MKILQVIPYFCFGGAETMCENLTYALQEQGHQVSVISLYDQRTPISTRMEQAGVAITYLDKKLGLDISMVPKLVRVMKKEKPDVVHSHLDVIKYAVAAAKLAGVRKCVHTVHNVADKEAEGTLQKIINRTYFRLKWSVPVALSPLVQQTIVDFYGMKEADVPVIYNGVDLTRCIPKKDYRSADVLKILHIGRFNEQKNHRRLLEAFALLAEQLPNVRLQMLGDGETMDEIRQYAAQLRLEERVCFEGSQSNVYPYLHEADLFVLPSDYEGMPMTIIEAMGTGLPIVATAVGGVPDMLADGQSGLLTECTAESVFRACKQLAENETLRQQLGLQAKQDCLRFSAQYMAQEYLKQYQQ